MTSPMPATGAVAASSASVIHDIGYKPYAGPRLGRGYIVRSLFWHSLRSAFGFGRGAWARVVPIGMFAIMMLPSIISVFQAATTPSDAGTLLPYDRYAHSLSLPLIVFVAVAAPELVTRDLRYRTLPLYFSRPLRRLDYPLAKLLALAAAILTIEVVPLLVMYVGTVASLSTGHAIWGQTKALAPGLLVACVYAAVFAPLTLLIASATKRRVLATGAIAILILATSVIAGVFRSVGTVQAQPEVISCAPAPAAPAPASAPAPAPPPSASSPGDALPGSCSDSSGGSGDGVFTPVYNPIAREGGLINPLSLIEGTRIWALHASDGEVPDPGPLGPVYALELVALIAVTSGGLVLRYRKAYVA
jgi:ABC-2 type transport system permease protein